VTRWRSPVPYGIGAFVRTFRSDVVAEEVATAICRVVWKGHRIRVFAWPCGTLAVTEVGSRGDTVLLRKCADRLLSTYARRSRYDGPTHEDVVECLRWARANP
jgi:hypothetical protein